MTPKEFEQLVQDNNKKFLDYINEFFVRGERVTHLSDRITYAKKRLTEKTDFKIDKLASEVNQIELLCLKTKEN